MFNEQSVNQVGSAILGLLMKLTLHLDVQQHVTLPAGPKIIAANHPATTDPFYLLGLMDEPLTLLVTEMAFHAP
jgi:1-acyl-sn-glycerol-3-phosphate acyltransferase